MWKSQHSSADTRTYFYGYKILHITYADQWWKDILPEQFTISRSILKLNLSKTELNRQMHQTFCTKPVQDRLVVKSPWDFKMCVAGLIVGSLMLRNDGSEYWFEYSGNTDDLYLVTSLATSRFDVSFYFHTVMMFFSGCVVLYVLRTSVWTVRIYSMYLVSSGAFKIMWPIWPEWSWPSWTTLRHYSLCFEDTALSSAVYEVEYESWKVSLYCFHFKSGEKSVHL